VALRDLPHQCQPQSGSNACAAAAARHGVNTHCYPFHYGITPLSLTDRIGILKTDALRMQTVGTTRPTRERAAR
jgi:hypothetical protein